HFEWNTPIDGSVSTISKLRLGVATQVSMSGITKLLKNQRVPASAWAFGLRRKVGTNEVFLRSLPAKNCQGTRDAETIDA
ncbi:MAG: hypothetical protein ACPHHT_10510, partial [Ilumatobacteraceae bacterium]